MPLSKKITSSFIKLYRGRVPHSRDFLPLYDRKRKILLSPAAKSGSVYVTRWFFYQSPFWEEAKDFPHWIHSYRQKVFYKMDEYEEAAKDFWSNPSAYTKIKVVRNPYARAVSAFIHTLLHPRILNEHIKKPLDPEGLSFSEFISYIETLNIKRCNPHFRVQTHYFERLSDWNYDQVIQLESSKEDFAKLEQQLGLKTSSFDELRESKHHSSRRDQDNKFYGETVFPYKRGEFSRYQHFYNDELIERIRRLYKEDFDAFDYDTKFS